MTWTNWLQPRKTQNLESNEILFDQSKIGRVLTSKKPVSGVSLYRGGLITVESTAIAFSNFGFDIGQQQVVGVELYLHTTRNARAQDKTIKLFAGKAVGKNLSDLEALDQHTYSGDLKEWGVNKLTIDYASEDFGVVVDLQPHTEYPSNVTIYIRKVQVRLQLA